MKKLTFLVLFVAGAAFTGFSQEKQNTPERIKLVPSGHQTQSTQLSKEEEIKKCEALLEALDIKEEQIRKNPEEILIASEAGWFENAAKQRKELKARIIELKK
ncbi:MAG: hypothetical protein ABJG68_12760 [Crocinitomicaceae bacterium]